MWNNRGPTDIRRVFTGKDGLLFSESGLLIATAQSFSSKATYNNAKVNFLGDAQDHEALQTYAITLTINEIIIRDNSYFQELMAALVGGYMPSWTFQGVIKGRNGSEQRIIYRECVPTGDIDLQNINVSDVFQRTWNLFCNNSPELQSLVDYD